MFKAQADLGDSSGAGLRNQFEPLNDIVGGVAMVSINSKRLDLLLLCLCIFNGIDMQSSFNLVSMRTILSLRQAWLGSGFFSNVPSPASNT